MTRGRKPGFKHSPATLRSMRRGQARFKGCLTRELNIPAKAMWTSRFNCSAKKRRLDRKKSNKRKGFFKKKSSSRKKSGKRKKSKKKLGKVKGVDMDILFG